MDYRRWAWVAAGFGALFLLTRKKARKSLSGLTILHVGDSHVGGLEPFLAKITTDAGAASFMSTSQVGWSTSRFADSMSTASLAEDIDPAIILVTLGTNDGLDPNKTGAAVHAIVEQASGIPVLWIGPPNMPREDIQDILPQLVEVLRENSIAAGARFFDSRAVEMDFTEGGVHPTRAGYEAWANAIYRAI